MSTPIKAPTIEDLVQQLSEVRKALTEERARLVDRIATIDQALGVTPEASPLKAKGKTVAPKAAKSGGIREAIANVLASKPNLTIKELQQAIPEHPASSVESTVRTMAADGSLQKDGETPRHFSLPATKTKAA